MHGERAPHGWQAVGCDVHHPAAGEPQSKAPAQLRHVGAAPPRPACSSCRCYTRLASFQALRCAPKCGATAAIKLPHGSGTQALALLLILVAPGERVQRGRRAVSCTCSQLWCKGSYKAPARLNCSSPRWRTRGRRVQRAWQADSSNVHTSVGPSSLTASAPQATQWSACTTIRDSSPRFTVLSTSRRHKLAVISTPITANCAIAHSADCCGPPAGQQAIVGHLRPLNATAKGIQSVFPHRSHKQHSFEPSEVTDEDKEPTCSLFHTKHRHMHTADA